MLKGTEHVLVKKILDEICEDEEAKKEIKPTWDAIVKAMLEHITAHATITGSTTTQIGVQPLVNGKIT